jgi:small subunit ribosomal protein S1
MEQEEDFAALFEASGQAKRFRNGQMIEGTIVAIGPEVAFVSVGGKGEATIAVEELKDDEGDIEVSVGDRIQATVVSNAGGLVLSRKMALGAASVSEVEDAFSAGLPVEGKVETVNKGGYEVRIARLRAFCPLSQIDTIRTEDPAVHLGRVYSFRIVEFRDGGRKFVVSRRALLEQDQAAKAAEIRKSLAVGDVRTGRVATVREFGAFVELGGGVQGLLHVSEMSWARVSNPSEMVKAGDEVTVKVVRIDEEKQQIALSLKGLDDDPWTKVPATYAVGQVLSGRITRITDFGALIELEPGIEGLAHASTFAPTGRAGGWSKSLTPGMVVTFEIITIDLEKKRLGLAVLEEGSARAGTVERSGASTRSGIVQGARLTGKVERHESFGVFVFLAPGRSGLMPFSETGVDKGADIKKALPVGSDIEVIVLEADPAGRRIRVSHKAVEQALEDAEVREYTQREEAAQNKSMGSLADKLRSALDRK